MNHTPTPWTLEQGDGHCKLFSANGPTGWKFIGEIQTGHACDLHYREDAEFIVSACNAHEELVAALRGMVDLMDNKPTSYEEDQQISKYRQVLNTIEKRDKR